MKRHVKRRMWYIGRIYRSSKGQQFHNKFIRKFLHPHLFYNYKSYIFNKYNYFNKISVNRNFIWPNLNFYGNIDKFHPGYQNSDFDNNFQFISRRLLKKLKIRSLPNDSMIFFVNGCIYMNTAPNKNFEITEMEDELFFQKNSITGGFINNTNPGWNLPFHFETDLELYKSLEIYKIISFGILNCLGKSENKS